MTSKSALAKSGEELSRETWEYNTFHLLSHTDTRGLTTHYTYDGAGRKISETAEGREKHFSYDALGFLERTAEGDVSHVQICDVEGHVIEEWIEEANDLTENWMCFSYDTEGRKEKAVRHTSQGNATDLFCYDEDGRLTKHTDPEGGITSFCLAEDGKVT
jgi:YD repeat-containing protein